MSFVVRVSGTLFLSDSDQSDGNTRCQTPFGSYTQILSKCVLDVLELVKEYCTYCEGSGGRHETRYDYDYEGRPISRDEYISCSFCSGTGQRSCSNCGGSGSIQKFASGTERNFGDSPIPDNSLADDSTNSVSVPLKSTEEILSELYQELYEAEEELENEIWRRLELSFISQKERGWLLTLKQQFPMMSYFRSPQFPVRYSAETAIARQKHWRQLAEMWQVMFSRTTGSDIMVWAMQSVASAYGKIVIFEA